MIRLLILAILLILSLTKFKNNYKLFHWTLFLYFIFLSLRCVQGLDYSSYGYYYNSSYGLLETFKNGLYFPQFGYVYNSLVAIFKTMYIPFEVFLAIINLFVLFQFRKFILNYSKNLMFSVFIIYSIYSISFIESALRQVIAIAIIFGILIELIKDKKWILSFVLSIITFDIHPSAIIFILFIYIIYIDKIYQFIKSNIKYIIIGMCLICIAVNLIGLDNIYLILPKIIRYRISYYFLDGVHYSILAILLRIIYLGLALLILNFKDLKEEEEKMLYLYLIGMFVYFIFAGIPIFSRLTIYFEFVEIIIFTYLGSLNMKNIYKCLLLLIYMAICSVVFFKDCLANVSLGQYKTNYLPYITIFQKDELEEYIDKDDNRMFRLYLSTFE